ncbi:MAG: hypothetical protein M3P50_01270 [Actinomycetota bacterium]|nr:hypothetical protein [Actinomycetota bacterium]
MSTPPPPSSRPPGEPREKRTRTREILLRLDADAAKGWRKRLLGGAGDGAGSIRLAGSEITFEHPATLANPLTILAGLVAVATVDIGRRSAAEGGEGRFAVLHRMSGSAVVPAEEGVEGWLWTSRSGSALPMLGDGTPNLALVFGQPLEAELVEAAFRPEFLSALADRSPLGAPTVFGLLARVADPSQAEHAFAELGVDRPLTDREVAPAQRRHLPSDRPANPSVGFSEVGRRRTSIPPPPPPAG